MVHGRYGTISVFGSCFHVAPGLAIVYRKSFPGWPTFFTVHLSRLKGLR